MENLKLISVRVDPRDLNDLDEIAKNVSYRKRSDLIQAGIRLIIAAHKQGRSRDILRFYPRYGDVVDKFEFKFHREHH